MKLDLKVIVEELDKRLEQLRQEKYETYNRNKEVHRRSDQLVEEARAEARQMRDDSDAASTTAARKLEKVQQARDTLFMMLKEQEDQP
jgi:hypothetical protein